MKINGVEIPNEFEPKSMIIPIGDQKVMLKYKPVFKFDKFMKKYPEPTPPSVIKPDGSETIEYGDTDYIKALDDWASSKTSWMIIEALEPSNIEWSQVDLNDPKTWKNVTDELSSTFGTAYTNKIVREIANYSGFNSELIDKATEDFLLEQQAQQSLKG